MLEHGVSLARVRYAFNSTNAEGWGLYSEYLIKPYMPLEGQLISLQMRLQRAARAFLDPELQSGKVTPKDAFRVLEQDVVLSHAMAQQEVERYTYRAPGQANSYFYGYTRLISLREETEKALSAKGREVRPEEISRLHPGAGTAAARLDAKGGIGEFRSVAKQVIRAAPLLRTLVLIGVGLHRNRCLRGRDWRLHLESARRGRVGHLLGEDAIADASRLQG